MLENEETSVLTVVSDNEYVSSSIVFSHCLIATSVSSYCDKEFNHRLYIPLPYDSTIQALLVAT